jgi:outer membrane protein OmpA-like peptidoglycan-associated protein
MAALLLGILTSAACAKRELQLEMTREQRIVPPVISSLSVDPSGRLDTSRETHAVTVRMVGDADLEATFDIDGRVTAQLMQEIEPGVYEGLFRIGQNEKGTLSITGHLLHPPTGAHQEYRLGDALALYVAPPPATCPPAMAAQFEQQLASLILFFAFDKFEVPAAQRDLLSSKGQVLQGFPHCSIQLHGHADNVGTPDYNHELGMKRAFQVRQILGSAFGMAADRFELYSHGETRPLDPADTDEARSKNRRVEFHAVYPY